MCVDKYEYEQELGPTIVDTDDFENDELNNTGVFGNYDSRCD